MKAILSFARQNILRACALCLISLACFVSASAQQAIPFVDCTERVDDSHYRAYFGYTLFSASDVVYEIDSPLNYFFPVSGPPGQPSILHPGVHSRVVAVTLSNDQEETWILGDKSATSNSQNLLPCTDAGNSTHTITYQGRLTNANAAANGQYDLQFQLFNAAAGGASQSEKLALSGVQVTNGIFTVQLDFGVLSAIVNGSNLFLEIAVRPSSTGSASYTTLTPRQPLTATPYAIRTQSAANADRLNGKTADQFLLTTDTEIVRTNDARLSNARTPLGGSSNYIQNTTTQQTGNFNISGNGTVGGNLNARTINAVGANDTLFRGVGSSTVGTRLALQNTTTGGATWNFISTGSNNGEGAGKLVFFNETSNTAPLQINGGGANIVGNLSVSGSINGTVSNATNAVNATNVSGGYVQLPLTTGAPTATECDETTEYGRMKVDSINGRLYICIASGWKSATLQ